MEKWFCNLEQYRKWLNLTGYMFEQSIPSRGIDYNDFRTGLSVFELFNRNVQARGESQPKVYHA